MKTAIGRYQIGHELEFAGQSTVYSAFDGDTGRSVALELVPIVADEDETERLREAVHTRTQFASQLHHEHIAAIYDVVEDHDLWVVREPVQGETIEHLLSTDALITKKLISNVLYHAATCLDYAHQLGIAHGALSPSELLVQDDGALKVLGFWKPSLASSGSVSPFHRTHYTAPEQIRGLPAEATSDQYSLATIAHELLTGATPFQGDAIAVRNRIVLDNPPDPSIANSWLGKDAGAVLLRALDKSPAARYETCLEFVEALSYALETIPIWILPEGYRRAVATPEEDQPFQLEAEDSEVLLQEVMGGEPPQTEESEENGRFARLAGWAPLAAALLVVSWVWYSASWSPKPVAELAIAELSPPPVVVNQPYTYSLQAEGGEEPYAWSVVEGSLPAGLTLEPGGIIHGESNQTGVYEVLVQVTESRSSAAATQQLSLTVKQGPRIKAPDTLQDAVVGREYSFPLGVDGGQRPYRWAIATGSVPPGMDLNSFSGFLGGRPQTPGTYRFAISVSDLFGAASTSEFELTVRPSPEESTERSMDSAAPIEDRVSEGGAVREQ